MFRCFDVSIFRCFETCRRFASQGSRQETLIRRMPGLTVSTCFHLMRSTGGCIRSPINTLLLSVIDAMDKKVFRSSWFIQLDGIPPVRLRLRVRELVYLRSPCATYRPLPDRDVLDNRRTNTRSKRQQRSTHLSKPLVWPR